MTPLERAAKALEEALREPVNRMWAKPDSEGIEPGDYLSAARAVLTAIREPSEGMVRANSDHWERGDDPSIAERWQVMIDAALSEGE